MKKHYSPVYRNGFTNHLPMYKQSMKRIGYSNDAIEKLSTQYAESHGLRDLEEPGLVLTEFEQRYLSKIPEYRELIAEKGLGGAVRAFLLGRKDTVASGLFHGLIRLAFGLDAEDSEETARAMAYFSIIAKPMLFPEGLKVSLQPEADWVALMNYRASMDLVFESSSTMRKALQILSTPKLANGISDIQIDGDTEKRMCAVFSDWYLRTRDFYVLHVMTGFQALLALKPYIVDFDEWLKAYWQMAHIFSLLTETRLPLSGIPTESWEQMSKTAPPMTDAHDAKLFYACMDLYRRYELEALKMIGYVIGHKLKS